MKKLKLREFSALPTITQLNMESLRSEPGLTSSTANIHFITLSHLQVWFLLPLYQKAHSKCHSYSSIHICNQLSMGYELSGYLAI